MTSIKLTAPAKVNLFLKVLNKRKDSYHNIITVFERISLQDEITIRKAPEGISVSSDRFITLRPEDNIAYKAARSFLDHIGCDRGVSIRIKKNIPIAAGLGGGSSDASAVLLGMNKLFGARIGKDALMRMASRIGADIPFFILETPFAVGMGIGDKLTVIKSPVRFWHLIVYPGFKVNTKDIYDYYDKRPNRLTKRKGGVRIHPLSGYLRQCGMPDSMLYNDLERVAAAKVPAIGKMIDRLAYILDTNVIVSGSGPSIFCLYETRKEALRARIKLYRNMSAGERKHWQIFLAETLTGACTPWRSQK